MSERGELRVDLEHGLVFLLGSVNDCAFGDKHWFYVALQHGHAALLAQALHHIDAVGAEVAGEPCLGGLDVDYSGVVAQLHLGGGHQLGDVKFLGGLLPVVFEVFLRQGLGLDLHFGRDRRGWRCHLDGDAPSQQRAADWRGNRGGASRVSGTSITSSTSTSRVGITTSDASVVFGFCRACLAASCNLIGLYLGVLQRSKAHQANLDEKILVVGFAEAVFIVAGRRQ